MASKVSGADRIRVCGVLERCADQLDILGYIMPNSRRRRSGAEGAAENLLKAVLKGQADESDLSDAAEKLHVSHEELRHTLGQSPSPHDMLAKVERDRQVVAKVITDLLAELQKTGTFHSLVKATEEERKRNEEEDQLHDTVMREDFRIKALQKQLADIQEEETSEVKRLDDMKTDLEQELQQISIKTSLEKNYAMSSAELIIYCGQKLTNQQEQELEEEKGILQARIEEETRAHMENASFLKETQTSLQKQQEYWMERYENDMQAMDQNLNSLKIRRTNTRVLLQDLAKQCREMEQVITEDHLEKENLRLQLEREQLEKIAATKIQAWWRGTLVRKGLASDKNNKPKSKGGKKGKGKKKK